MNSLLHAIDRIILSGIKTLELHAVVMNHLVFDDAPLPSYKPRNSSFYHPLMGIGLERIYLLRMIPLVLLPRTKE